MTVRLRQRLKPGNKRLFPLPPPSGGASLWLTSRRCSTVVTTHSLVGRSLCLWRPHASRFFVRPCSRCTLRELPCATRSDSLAADRQRDRKRRPKSLLFAAHILAVTLDDGATDRKAIPSPVRLWRTDRIWTRALAARFQCRCPHLICRFDPSINVVYDQAPRVELCALIAAKALSIRFSKTCWS